MRMIGFRIADRTYELGYRVVEPYRPATFHDPEEGELEPHPFVDVYRHYPDFEGVPDTEGEVRHEGMLPYEEFLHLLQESEGLDDVGGADGLVQRAMWRDYDPRP